MANRVGVVSRKTNETDIQMELNLDGSGYAKVDTGIGFFDHMLISFAKHGFFDLNCKVDRGFIRGQPPYNRGYRNRAWTGDCKGGR